jgi:hypothetical protein
MRWLRTSAAIAVAAVLSALAAASALAQITIGQFAPGTNPSAYCVLGPFDGAPTGSAAAGYTVPTAGVITSWSTNASEGAGQLLNFKVYRPLGGGKYLVVGHDGPRTLTPSVVNTFQASIPVQAGDVIGNDDTNASTVPSACEFETGNPGDTAWLAPGEATDGATIQAEPEEENEVRANETATLLPPPTISGLAPASGSIAGGASVVISGANFAEVKSVSFGAAPASAFTVGSDGQITATAPPTASRGPVSVAVTTVAGTATAAQRFAYKACVVPKLKGRTLKAAKKRLRKADCKLGKVNGHKSNAAKVTKQRPKAGKVLRPGSKVNVNLG